MVFLPPPLSPQSLIFPSSIPLSKVDYFLHLPFWNHQSKKMGRSTWIPSILHRPLPLPCLLQVRVMWHKMSLKHLERRDLRASIEIGGSGEIARIYLIKGL